MNDRQANRYQNQTRLVKAYRWLRWKPLYSAKFCLAVASWALKGAPLPEPVTFNDGRVVQFHPTRRSVIRHLQQYYRSLAGMEMQHWFTLDECIQDAKRRGKLGELTTTKSEDQKPKSENWEA